MSDRRRAAMMAGTVAAAVMMGSVWARSPEDDLTLVKRAVADQPAGASEAQAAKKGEPKWLKVRIHERTGKKARVVVNLPLALVRAVGDDVPMDWDCGKDEKPRRKCSIKISEILEALDSGQDLVQIESDDATVRVWVE